MKRTPGFAHIILLIFFSMMAATGILVKITNNLRLSIKIHEKTSYLNMIRYHKMQLFQKKIQPLILINIKNSIDGGALPSTKSMENFIKFMSKNPVQVEVTYQGPLSPSSDPMVLYNCIKNVSIKITYKYYDKYYYQNISGEEVFNLSNYKSLDDEGVQQ